MARSWSAQRVDFPPTRESPGPARTVRVMKPKRSMRRVAAFALACLWSCSAALSDPPPPVAARWQPRLPPTDARNLVPNSGFELGGAGWSSLGESTGWSGDLSSLFGTVTAAEKFEGGQSLEVVLGPGRTPVTYYDCWPATTVVQLAPLAVNLGWITVTPGETYTLSAYLKADRAGVPARLVMRFGGDPAPDPTPANSEKAVTLTDKWERYSFTFKATSVSVCVGVGPDLRGHPDAKARVWIDAVQFEPGSQPSDYAPRAPLEASVDSGRFGNVFSAGAPVTLRVAAVNRSGKPADIAVAVSLTDYFDAGLPEQRYVIHAPPGRSVCEEIPVTVPGTGYYRVTAVATAGELHHESSFPMAVVQEYQSPRTLFGLNHAPTNPDLLRQFRRAGIFWAREWSLDWQEVQPKPGAFRWEEADRQVGRLEQAGWKVLALLPAFASAKWASSMPPDIHIVPTAWRAPAEWVWLAAAPRDPADLTRYLQNTISRYRGRIGTWEFLNEPTTSTALPAPYRGVPGFTYNAQDYLKLLKLASKTIREADPHAQLVGGFSLEVLHRAPEFIRDGGLGLIDILNIHPYGFFEDAPEYFIPQMEELAALMDASPAGRKPIWVTEAGYYAEDDKPRKPWVDPSFPYPMENEKVAADHSVRHAIIMLSHGVEKIFYHQGSSGEVNDGMRDLGNPLLGPGGTPQKFYPALAYLANLLGPDFKYAAPLSKPASLDGFPTDSVYGYAFQAGNKAVLAAWAPAGRPRDHRWMLKIPRDVDAYSIVGTKLQEGGNGHMVALGDSPVYLVTELMPASDLARAQILRTSSRTGTPSAPSTQGF
ncbi:MAG: hypothetical protein JWM88_1370 [Verrucomicrobia bacterium]|nr:hypothetical protein [Verrucomicrobiota bacterium]